ncbi:alpha/beta fold hydrolase [Methanobrevibacter sp. 87.7]|uniref:alpha/beta fold hydrolase n=1 Tax=Methanobrevibacter sp. 87.7 TaxID=387957 RepID=UPI000B50500B|nr:alpha/beta fold hydrolase [Methanobrevibacter sp. 87.7]
MFSDLDFEKPEYFTLDKFKFSTGDVLENVDVEYITVGTPIYNDDGEIINGVLYCHGSSGDYGSLRRINDISGSGEVFDTDKLFLISLSSLGSPRSLSPSMTNLKGDFPHYSIIDMVNFQRQFLKEKFNITHLKGMIGNSMGGFTVLTWAAYYPLEMDFVISLVSSYKVAGHNYALSRIMDDIVKSCPDYNDGDYIASEELNRTFKLANEVMFNYGFSREFYRNKSNYEIDLSIEEMLSEDTLDDINDMVYRNDASLNYNIEDKLKDIVAKVLIVAINQDQYFPPNLDAIPMSHMIKNSELLIYDSINGHIGSRELKKVESNLKEFLNEFI